MRATALSEAPVIVLAGGLGTRLRSAVPDRPKILAPAAGRPFLAWLLADLARQGARRVVLSLGHGAGQVVSALPACRPADLVVDCVTEDRPLGTGGALRHTVERLGLTGPLYLLNGDTWIEDGLAAIAGAETDSPALLGLTAVEDSGRYGGVSLEPSGLISAFREKGESGPGLISAGLLRMESALLAAGPLGPFSLERDLLAPLAAEGRLGGLRLAGRFVDIGIPEDYKAFCAWAEEVLAARLSPATPPLAP